MPLKKSIRLKKSTHVNKSTRHSNKSPRLKEYIRLAGRTGAGTIALALTSVAASALMLAGHQPYHPAALVSVDAQARTAAPQDGAKTAARQDVAKRAAQQEGADTAAQQDGAKTASPDGAKTAALSDGAYKGSRQGAHDDDGGASERSPMLLFNLESMGVR